MVKKAISVVLLTMLLIGMLTLAFFPAAEASEFGNEVEFRGIAISDEKWGEIVAYGSYYCDVTVLEVLYDPDSTLSLNDNVTVAYQKSLSLHVGDEIECYGTNCINCTTAPKQCYGYVVCKPSPYYVTLYPPKLLLETDKTVYKLRENVTITLTNISNETIQIGGYPAWQIFTYPEEEPVYPKIFAFLAWSLDPGENDTFIWNQYNEFNESFCSPGTYAVRDTQGWGLSAYFKISILGDVDGDFRVTMGDMVTVCEAFGSRIGQLKYNPNCDINDDQRISMDDIIIAGDHFGQHHP